MVSRHERVIKGPVESEHIVQLFDTPESLGSGVAAFLARGLADEGKLLVVARPQHVAAIGEALRAAGYDVDALIASETLTILDARATLQRFMRGLPDRELFEAHVADVVRRLAAGSAGQLHAYGEMVDLLAEDGSFSAIDMLEELWNELAATASFTLLCGYASSHFAAAHGGERLQTICRQHTRVDRASDDLLGNWLLNTSTGDSAA